MNKHLASRPALPAVNRQALFVMAFRLAVLALASALAAGCSLNPPKPPRCDGSERRAVNSVNPTVALSPPSKSCGQAASTLGARDSG